MDVCSLISDPNIELDSGSMLRYGDRGGLTLVRGHKQVADKQRHVSHLQLWAALPASTAEQRAIYNEPRMVAASVIFQYLDIIMLFNI